jgi:hypothetical protein
MKADQIKLVKIELNRVRDRIKALVPGHYTEFDGKSFAALKRASMDLTRALAELRRS